MLAQYTVLEDGMEWNVFFLYSSLGVHQIFWHTFLAHGLESFFVPGFTFLKQTLQTHSNWFCSSFLALLKQLLPV